MDSSQMNILDAMDRESSKRTWRGVFRVTTIIMVVTCVVLSAIILSKVAHPQGFDTNELSNGIVDRVSDKITEALTVPNNQIGEIFKIVALDLPVLVSSSQQAIAGQIGMLAESINSILSQNGSASTILSSSPEYAGGIGVPLFSNKLTNGTVIKPITLIEHPSFIPGPTTIGGCTRIPTFHMASSHWCYSHNIIEKGCKDSGISSMYISLGVLQVLKKGTPVFLVTASAVLSDDRNRKSCSIISSRFGCEILCSLVTEAESDDYKSDTPTGMVHGRLYFNGTYREELVDTETIFRDFSANYPGVGSGEIVEGHIHFPIYGGVKQNTGLYNSLTPYWLDAKNKYDYCKLPYTNKTIQNSYKPPFIHGRFWAQGILSCELDLFNLGNCNLKIIRSDKVMMGAESRLMLVGSKLLMYQRASSWWPLGITQEIDIAELHSSNTTILREVKPILSSKFPRPSYQPNYCTKPSVCPAVCVTGVYTDMWPISITGNISDYAWISHYLDAPTSRQQPRIGIANQYFWIHQTTIFPTNTQSSYSTTTCFRNQVRSRMFCLSIAEFSDGVFGEFRIVPLLYELRV
uniref:Hemagglutinin-neuraminidase n=1 Tax=Metaavulavirus falklandense TaxID=2560309 RepID=A0A1Q2HT48_9MONO|nr:HN [Metaavulavirus falklandense]